MSFASNSNRVETPQTHPTLSHTNSQNTSSSHGTSTINNKAQTNKMNTPACFQYLGHGNLDGTVTLKPLEVKFFKHTDADRKIAPYCKFSIGFHSKKSSAASTKGASFVWNNELKLQRKHGEEFATVKCKDENRSFWRNNLGSVKINLDDLAGKGKDEKWYTLTKGSKITGQILMHFDYIGDLVIKSVTM